MTAFLREFKHDENKLVMTPSIALPELQYLEHVLAGQPIETDSQKKMKQHCDEKTITWLKTAFTNHDLDFKHHSDSIVCILLDIILYKDPTIVNTGFILLTNYF